MDASATALMMLLVCSSTGEECRELRRAETYPTPAACREALPSVVQRLSGARYHVTGRCMLAAEAPPFLDPLTTGTIAGISGDLVTVYVTRHFREGAVSESYEVPAMN